MLPDGSLHDRSGGAADTNDPVTGPGKREQAKAARRSRILNAARELIRETGDTNLAMRELARRAGVSVATAYNLFGSKRAVMLAVLEDERDFLRKYQKLPVSNAIDRIFEAHALGYGYFVEDAAFYRPLWRALLSTDRSDDTGLLSPERLARSRNAWQAILIDARSEALLDKRIDTGELEGLLSHLALGYLLSWAAGTLQTQALIPSVGLGYAMVLKGAATTHGHEILDRRIKTYRSLLSSQARS